MSGNGPESEAGKHYPIGYVALATGLSPHVIRVWEKRYKAVAPGRSGKRRRLYSQSDIDRLKLLMKARTAGRRIGSAVMLDQEALRRIDRLGAPGVDAEGHAGQNGSTLEDPSELLQACEQAVRRMDGPALERALRRAGTRLPRAVMMADVITPLLHGIGDGWVEGSLRIIHEHFASNSVKGYLATLLSREGVIESAPDMVVATPAGQLCEIGAMMAAVAATDCGWNAWYFGPDLPAEEIAAAAVQKRAGAVALSISCPADDSLLGRELSLLRKGLGDSVQLFVGGQAAGAYELTVEAVGGRYFRSIREYCEVIAPAAVID